MRGLKQWRSPADAIDLVLSDAVPSEFWSVRRVVMFIRMALGCALYSQRLRTSVVLPEFRKCHAARAPASPR